MAVVVLAVATVALGCSPREAAPEEQRREPKGWVVVSFDVDPSDPAMLQLLDTERAVEKALRRSGAGVIDGNEVGQGTYELYVVGSDAEEMWRVVEPELADAPAPWTRVELRRGLRDDDPRVIVPR